ncbi:MAG: AMP-binding protein, partial [Rikenellaceae bacterium]|nr:AMP-binding protein [Rikenellaceae bacterium]
MKKTIIDLFESSVEKYPSNTLLLEKTGGEFRPTTYVQAREQAIAIGAGLAATGLKPSQAVSILAEGCNNWILSELGIFYAGGISVPLSVKLEEKEDVLFRLRHAEVSVVMVSSSQLQKVRALRGELPGLRLVVLFDERDTPQQDEITMAELVARGNELLASGRDKFLEIGHALKNDDYATITYTSGTTADPKGVILTHRNYTANVEQALTCMDIPPHWRTLIILPLDHCFAHVVGFYIIIASGAAAATLQVGRSPIETLKNIPGNIKEVRPHFLLTVPAVAKNFRKNIEGSIRAKGAVTEKLFKFALKIAYAYNKDGYSRGTGAAAALKPLVALFDKILFSKVREAFGGELQFFVGGGALLDSELQRFFYAIGIPMYQGYGLSEATPIISTNAPRAHKFGTSGRLVQPLDLRIMDEQRH